MPVSVSKSKAEDSRVAATDQAKVASKKGKLVTDQAMNVEVGKGAKINSTETTFAGVGGNVTITNTAEGAQAIAKDFIAGTLELQKQSSKALQDALAVKAGTPDPTDTTSTSADPGDAAGDADTIELFGLSVPRKSLIAVGLLIGGFVIWKMFFKK